MGFSLENILWTFHSVRRYTFTQQFFSQQQLCIISVFKQHVLSLVSTPHWHLHCLIIFLGGSHHFPSFGFLDHFLVTSSCSFSILDMVSHSARLSSAHSIASILNKFGFRTLNNICILVC